MSVLADNMARCVRIRSGGAVTLSWKVSRSALALVRPDLASPDPGVLMIEWIIPHAGHAVAMLRDPETDRRVELLASCGTPVWTSDPATGLEHVDIAGVLSASYRQGNGSPPQVLYARTRLIEQLRVAGGRYELAGIRVEPA